MKTLYAVTPRGVVLGVAVRMKDMRWVFTQTGGKPGRSSPTAEQSMPISVRRQGATFIEARDMTEASFRARQIPLFGMPDSGIDYIHDIKSGKD